jgi:hypothetical protein
MLTEDKALLAKFRWAIPGLREMYLETDWQKGKSAFLSI